MMKHSVKNNSGTVLLGLAQPPFTTHSEEQRRTAERRKQTLQEMERLQLAHDPSTLSAEVRRVLSERERTKGNEAFRVRTPCWLAFYTSICDQIPPPILKYFTEIPISMLFYMGAEQTAFISSGRL